MQTFVDRVALALKEQFQQYEQLTVVVPSQRLVTYLQHALYNAHQQPVLLPRIITIDALIQDAVRVPIIEKTQALFELFKVFEANPVPHEIHSFDAFLNWGQLLLNDFDEIDRYCIEAKQLFKNLRDVREIEAWSFNNETLSEGQLRYMAFWEKLGEYYFSFEQVLQQLELTTKGKSYRKVAEEIDLLTGGNDMRFAFVGFNALSESELRIFRQLHVLGRGVVFADNDRFYLDDAIHEAGVFQRTLRDRLAVKQLDEPLDVLRSEPKNIEVIECAQTTSQSAIIGSKLLELSSEELNNTLILLADEKLLSTLIHHLPKQIQQANITLGLPLRQTPMRSWVEIVFQLQEGLERRGKGSIYFRDLVQFIHHPFVLAAFPKEELEALYRLEADCLKNNWSFVTAKHWSGLTTTSNIMEKLLTPWKGSWTFALQTISELNAFFDTNFPETAAFEQTVIRTFEGALDEIKVAFEQTIPTFGLNTFRNLFNQQWQSEKLAYFGNPIDGVQIMGLLETRGIDFERMYVLGLNEDAMPPTNPIQTLIPMDLRRFFGLPTPREKQGLFAHHFYRLLHRAKDIVITYTSAQDTFGSSEPSRYLQQIELELVPANPNIHLKKSVVELGKTEDVNPIEVKKTPEMLQRFDELLQEGLTFSKLKDFVGCPLNFYYRYVLKIGEEEKLEEEVEASTLGTIMHEVLEVLFTDFLPREGQQTRFIQPEDIEQMRKEVPLLVEQAFARHFNDDPTAWQTGNNHIQYELAKDRLDRVLRREKELLAKETNAQFHVLGLETELKTTMEVEVNGVKKPLVLKGIIDRIDRFNANLRVIDYKSGKVEDKEVSIGKTDLFPTKAEAIIDRFKHHKKYHGLQLMVYQYLIEQNWKQQVQEAGIFSFTTTSTSPFFRPKDELEESIAETVERVISIIVNDLYAVGLPLTHNPESKYCAFCNGKTTEF